MKPLFSVSQRLEGVLDAPHVIAEECQSVTFTDRKETSLRQVVIKLLPLEIVSPWLRHQLEEHGPRPP